MKAIIVYMAGPALPRIVTLANGPASPLQDKSQNSVMDWDMFSLRANLRQSQALRVGWEGRIRR